MKHREEAAQAENEKETGEATKERRDKLFTENREILEDPIFQKIVSSIETGWDALSDKDKETILDVFAELLTAIKNYDDSYRTLKGVLKYKLSDEASSESTKRHQEHESEADRREHELHEAFLDSVNILSRRMKELGLDNSWRADEAIYPISNDHEANRTKVKRWMFRVFSES